MPMVENPPLARALHATVEIDEEIPPEHYKAVAEVIGYVMRLQPGGGCGTAISLGNCSGFAPCASFARPAGTAKNGLRTRRGIG